MITLYGGPTPNARKIAIALIEMGLEWRLEPGAHRVDATATVAGATVTASSTYEVRTR